MNDCFDTERAEALSRKIRINILRSISAFGQGHLGGSMSIADVLGVLYSGVMNIRPEEPRWSGRDYLVCSKGHTGPAIYGALAARGFFPEEKLDTLNQLGTMLPSHCDRLKTPGVDMTAGSLGQGLSAAAGIALGIKMDAADNYCYAIIGDGESQEGQIWEAIMFAGHNELDHLILFVDNNGEQLDGRVTEVNRIDNYRQRLESFYWNCSDVDGHNVNEIYQAICRAKQQSGAPSAIILHTVKGKGSFAEGRFNHSMPVTKEEAQSNIAELMRQAQ